MKYPSEWANRMKVVKRNKGPNPRARARARAGMSGKRKTRSQTQRFPGCRFRHREQQIRDLISGADSHVWD